MKKQLLFAVKLLTITGAYLFTRSRTPPNRLTAPEKSIAVLFLLENLKRVLLRNADLIRGAKTQVEILDNDVRLLKAFLKDCGKIGGRDAKLDEFAARIEAVVREGEDAIAAFTKEEEENRTRDFARRAFFGPVKLIGVANEVKAVRAKVKSVFDESIVFSGDRKIGSAAEAAAEAEGENLAYL